MTHVKGTNIRHSTSSAEQNQGTEQVIHSALLDDPFKSNIA